MAEHRIFLGAPKRSRELRYGSVGVRSFASCSMSLSFFVDDKEVYGLRRGERYSFEVDPGWHSLSYLIGLNECGQKFEFSARGQYTFRLLPTCGIE